MIISDNTEICQEMGVNNSDQTGCLHASVTSDRL